METANQEIIKEWILLTERIKKQLEKEFDPTPNNIDQISGRLASMFLDDRLIVKGLFKNK